MIKIDLITGFLGSGKTTFLLKYARYLLNQGLKIGIFAFDRGPVNIDMSLLHELRCEQCEIEMLAGCCDAESHQRRFKTRLIAMGMSGYDRVLIEPSGVFDIDEFFDTLHESPLDRWYEIGNIITVVDAKLENDLSEEADFLLASQAANAGCILFSRIQLATDEEQKNTIAHLQSALHKIHCSAPVEPRIFAKDWALLTDDDFRKLSSCSYRLYDYVKTIAGRVPDFQSLSWLDLPYNRQVLQEKVSLLFSAPERYGEIFRIKGILEENGSWYQLNATKKEIHFDASHPGGKAIIVIGNNLKEENIKTILNPE